MLARTLSVVLLSGLAACSSRRASPSVDASASVVAETRLPGDADRALAPAFEGATAWLNVDHPLDLAALKGRVVVVDFWTSGCINCIHTLATLKKLEAHFASEPVVVIGVHSPKFDAEGESTRLATTLAAYDLHHPVAIDADRAIWDRWNVNAWPTVFVLDTEGRTIWSEAGEPNPGELTSVVAGALAEAGDRLAKGPLPGLVANAAQSTALAYPGKVSALGDGRLAISDTAHHRIVVVRADGSVEHVIGNGLAGKVDGPLAECSFSAPQGTSYENGVLYIADTENHVIRAANLAQGTVTTIAGTGELGALPLGATTSDPRKTPLRSPWDVLARDGQLYLALAGSHQIGVLDLQKQALRRFAGSGREALIDGAASAAAFAQPSGLATDGKSLFVADPESSAVRRVDLASGVTHTLIGQGLFVFGDVDGDRKTARLQHALGIAYASGALYVVDTYNSKLKKLDLGTGVLNTILGGSDRVALFEPGGISSDGNRLIIADTNHQRVVAVPLAGATSVTPIVLTGLTAPARGVAVAAARESTTLDPKAPDLHVAWRVAKTGPATLRLTWRLPAGTAINEEAPAHLRWVSAVGLAKVPAAVTLVGKQAAAGLSVAVEVSAANASFDGVLDVVTCDAATHRVCVPVRRNVRATITRGAEQLSASAALPAAR